MLRRDVFRFDPFGWSGGTQKQYDEFSKTIKWDCTGSVEYQGTLKDDASIKAENSGRIVFVVVNIISGCHWTPNAK